MYRILYYFLDDFSKIFYFLTLEEIRKLFLNHIIIMGNYGKKQIILIIRKMGFINHIMKMSN